MRWLFWKWSVFSREPSFIRRLECHHRLSSNKVRIEWGFVCQGWDSKKKFVTTVNDKVYNWQFPSLVHKWVHCALSTARLSRWLDNSAVGPSLRFGDKFPIWSNIYCRPIFWFAKTSQNCPTVGVFLFLITTNDNAHCELHVSGPDDMWAPELPLWILALPKCALVIIVPSQFLRGKYNTKEQGAT